MLVANNDLSEDVVYKFLEAYTNLEELGGVHAMVKQIASSMLRWYLSLPSGSRKVFPGAGTSLRAVVG